MLSAPLTQAVVRAGSTALAEIAGRPLLAWLLDEVGDGRRLPQWREQLKCERCGLITRERALLHAL